MLARRLKPYFQAHPIIIPTRYLLLQTLHKPNISGRMSKCALELSEFDITFTPSKVIKAQPLADFLVELTPKSQNEESKS